MWYSICTWYNMYAFAFGYAMVSIPWKQSKDGICMDVCIRCTMAIFLMSMKFRSIPKHVYAFLSLTSCTHSHTQTMARSRTPHRPTQSINTANPYSNVHIRSQVNVSGVVYIFTKMAILPIYTHAQLTYERSCKTKCIFFTISKKVLYYYDYYLICVCVSGSVSKFMFSHTMHSYYL